MSWKSGFYAVLAVLIASNSAWAYLAVDHGVTDSYSDVSHQETRQQLALMKRLMPDAAQPTRADVVALLRRSHPDALIVDDSTGVSIRGLRFEFEGDRLARIGEFGTR